MTTETPTPSQLIRPQFNTKSSEFTHLLQQIISRPVVQLQREPVVNIELLRLRSNVQRAPHFGDLERINCDDTYKLQHLSMLPRD